MTGPRTSPLAPAAGRPVHASGEPLRWRSADSRVQAATSNGEHAGFIVREDAGYLLYDLHSRPLGVYPDLRTARAALSRPATHAAAEPAATSAQARCRAAGRPSLPASQRRRRRRPRHDRHL